MTTRRRSLGFVVMVMAVALISVGSAGSARADQRSEDYGSKAQFKFYCEAAGGRFVQGQYGDTYCYYANGDWENCDSQGNDCWYTPKPRTNPGPEPIDNLDDLEAAPEIGQSSPSTTDIPESNLQVTAGNSQTADEHADGAPQKKAKDKHKKKNKRNKR